MLCKFCPCRLLLIHILTILNRGNKIAGGGKKKKLTSSFVEPISPFIELYMLTCEQGNAQEEEGAYGPQEAW